MVPKIRVTLRHFRSFDMLRKILPRYDIDIVFAGHVATGQDAYVKEIRELVQGRSDVQLLLNLDSSALLEVESGHQILYGQSLDSGLGINQYNLQMLNTSDLRYLNA